MNKEKEKIYFNPGDIVIVKQHDMMDYAPRMVVVGPISKRFKNEGDDIELRGIQCRWFTKNLELQECIFSTKDLEIVSRYNK